MIQVTVSVQDSVYDELEQFAKNRGLDVTEGVKWLLGDFVHHNVSFPRYPGQPPGQIVAQVIPVSHMPIDDLLAMSRFLLADNLKKNDTRCPHCQAVLTIKDIEINGCSSCNKKLV